MEKKQLYYQDLILKNLRPYVDEVKKYFGLEHPVIELEMELVKDDPERTYEMIEFVTMDELKAILTPDFPAVAEHPGYLGVLWLVANLYHKGMHSAYQDYIQNDLNQESNILRCIQKDIAKLYLFLQDHPQECKMTIAVGKDKLELDDDFGWFQSVMKHHVFPNAIPEIKTEEDAEAILRKKAGRPQTREEVNAIVNGIARMFAEDDIVKGKAPKELCEFILKFLTLMELVEPDDTFVTNAWIKSQISNLQKPGKDPRFDSFGEIKPCTAEDLKDASVFEKTLNWILPPSR